MPRAVTLGNGKMLVGLDYQGQVRDLYFPYVGLENHITNQWAHTREAHRVGVFVDGVMRWLDAPGWSIDILCEGETGSSKITAHNEKMQLRLFFDDVVYNELNIFVRAVTVKNLAPQERDIKLFFSQPFHISESRRGDTAYYDPRCKAVIHYKGKRVFLVNAECDGESFDEYSVGVFEIEGRVGTYVDAEDGALSGNPIEHGSVDSVIGLSRSVAGEGSAVAYYWIAAGMSVTEAQDLNAYVLKKTPQHLMKTTKDFWHSWVNRQNFTFHGLDSAVVEAFKRALIIVRMHADNRGAVIASSDSDMLQRGRDTYSYMWPRDGAYAALALDRAGDSNVARRFFSFCKSIVTDEGYFMHKYRPDGSLGSSWHPWIRDGKTELPIQGDETAIILVALWRHYLITKDLEFIEELYNPLIRRSANFLAGFMHKETGLVYPSYDLWEEHFGISTYTCGVTYAALNAAANFAALLGKEESAASYRKSAQKLQKATIKHLYDPERGVFCKLAAVGEGGTLEKDWTLDMGSFHGVAHFGVLEPGDTRLQRFAAVIEEELCLSVGIGGVPRYTDDMYYRVGVGGETPPNPWFVTTLWLAQHYIQRAERESDLEPVKKWLGWAVRHATSSGIMSEQLNPYTGDQLSAAPLTWSHAEFIITVSAYLDKLEELGVCEACNPVY